MWREEKRMNNGLVDKINMALSYQWEKQSSEEISCWPLMQINLHSESYNINLIYEP